MQVIRATRPRQCTECRKDTLVVTTEVRDNKDRVIGMLPPATPMNGLLTVLTECADCQIRYIDTFRLF
jgi:hypothetical protein